MGIDFWTGAVIVVVATGLYTAWGGLRAVLYTDLIQMFVLIGGAVVVVVIGLQAVGGWEALRQSAGEQAFSLWKPMSHPDFPWTGILFGAPILAVWYWCTDQYIVQRVLSAHGIEDARRGTIFAALLKQAPLFIFVVPGMIAGALAAQGRLDLPEADAALPALVQTLLPVGLKGLVVAGLLAALMSSLSSVFNSCSTIVTMDLYTRFRPDASQRTLVLVGQVSTVVLVGLGLAWIPFMKNVSGQLFTYLQSVQAYIAPPIAAVFLIGVLWRRVNAQGAMWALSVGMVLGALRLVLELNKDGLSGAAFAFADANFLHMAFFLFLVSAAVLIGVSLATQAPPGERVETVTVGGRGVTVHTGRRGRDILLSGGVLLLIAAVWVYFS